MIGNKNSHLKTISAFRNEQPMMGLLSMIELASVDEALSVDRCIVVMQEELNQFHRNDVHDLIAKPPHKNIIWYQMSL